MASEDDPAAKRALNIHELLKYNPKPRMSQVLKNLEQAKQHDLKKNTSFGEIDEITKFSGLSQRSRQDLDIKSALLCFFSE